MHRTVNGRCRCACAQALRQKYLGYVASMIATNELLLGSKRIFLKPLN